MATSSFDKRFVVKTDSEVNKLKEVLAKDSSRRHVDSSIGTAHRGDPVFKQLLSRYKK